MYSCILDPRLGFYDDILRIGFPAAAAAPQMARGQGRATTKVHTQISPEKATPQLGAFERSRRIFYHDGSRFVSKSDRGMAHVSRTNVQKEENRYSKSDPSLG